MAGFVAPIISGLSLVRQNQQREAAAKEIVMKHHANALTQKLVSDAILRHLMFSQSQNQNSGGK